MIRTGIIAVAAIALFPLMANASIKDLNCKLVSDDGVTHIVHAKIGDASDKAEVQSYATTADCAKDNSCPTDIYKKEVLPSVIRLIDITVAGQATFTVVMDISRTDLSIITRTKLKTPIGDNSTIGRGKCTVKTEKEKKVL